MLHVLADSDNSLVTVEVIFGTLDAILTIGMAWLAMNQREIGKLKSNLEASSKSMVALELANHTTPLKTSIDNLAQQIKSIHARLDEGDGDFKEIGEKRESMSIQMERKFGELRVFLAENFSSKADMKEHESSVARKFEHMNETTQRLAVQVAVLANKQ